MSCEKGRTVSYSRHVVRVVRTRHFETWIRRLKDRSGRLRVLKRIDRLMSGNPGDVRPVGEGVSELRIDAGPGYRVYYLRDGDTVILLLCGGDKATQPKDIDKARELAREWRADMKEVHDDEG